jgi:thiazole synthase
MMLEITLNGQRLEVPGPLTIDQLLKHLGMKAEHVAVERNRDLVPRRVHSETEVASGDVLEIVTLVGGGGPDSDLDAGIGLGPLVIGTHTVRSRLFVGTGKYTTLELMRDCLEISGAEVVTVAVRRERLFDREGRNLLDFLDPRRYTILPNTAGCFSAEESLRTARLGRELLEGLGNPGADWVKLEVLADTRTLLPDPVATLEATKVLVKEGFQVLCYTSDDPIMARRLKEAGAASVMPAGSPIGSGQGVLNPNNIRIILEDLKADDPTYPVIVDAGVGTASDVAIAMELGCDGVLLNTGIAGASDPRRMARAMKLAI